MEWIKFSDRKPEEQPSMFANKYGTPDWKDGIMWQTERYNLLFTIEHKGKRTVVRGQMRDGMPECELEKWYNTEDKVKYISWMEYPEPCIE